MIVSLCEYVQELEVESLRTAVVKLNNYCQEYILKSIMNIKDLTVVLMENALIEQATENHRNFMDS